MSLATRLRDAMAAPATMPPLSGDLPDEIDGPAIPAAVLIAVTERDEPGVILTVRRESMRTHGGQIAFPGGRVDPGESAIGAALREAKEEMGLEPSAADVIGLLDDYRTVTGFAVTPVLAVIPPDLALAPNELEVADWFEAPLAHLLDPAKRRREGAVFRGRLRHYYAIDWNGLKVWGATAAMLVNLSRRLAWA